VFAAIISGRAGAVLDDHGRAKRVLERIDRSLAEVSMPPPAGKPEMIRMVRSDCASA